MEIDEEFSAPAQNQASETENSSVMNTTTTTATTRTLKGPTSDAGSMQYTETTATTTATSPSMPDNGSGLGAANTTATTTTNTRTINALVPTNILAGSPRNSQMDLRIQPAISFSPVGMAMSMFGPAEIAGVQSLLPDSHGICHYHRPVGIFEKLHANRLSDRAHQLVVRSLAPDSSSLQGDGVKQGALDSRKRVLQRVLERMGSNASNHSYRLDSLRSEHMRKFQWQEQRVRDIRRKELERGFRYRPGNMPSSSSSFQNSEDPISIEEIDNEIADTSLEDKTMVSEDNEDKLWVSDTEYDLDQANDILTLEALEMTERMRRRAFKRRTTGGGVAKETGDRSRRKVIAAVQASIPIKSSNSSNNNNGSSGGSGSGSGTRRGRASKKRDTLAQAYLRQVNDESDTRRLISNLGSGDPEDIIKLLRRGASVNMRDSFDRTPLHVASSGGNVDSIRLLIHMGADVNATDRIGNTPLTLAATGARSDAILALLEGGADPRVGHGLVSAMSMVRSRLRLLRAEIQQARAVERAATGNLSDLIPRVRERRRRAAAVAKECVDIIHLLRFYMHKRFEEEKSEPDAGSALYEAYVVSQTDVTSTTTTTTSTPAAAATPAEQDSAFPSSRTVDELDTLSAQLLSLGIGEGGNSSCNNAGNKDKGKMPDLQGSGQGADNPFSFGQQSSSSAAEEAPADNGDEDDEIDRLLEKFSQLLG
ncbi:hypothetical protein LPJ53_003628 [Coemansia erecta]|uniref:Ankyrin n=1 Tax=Coemansia erecta TaxID=147472 RepID=A0A9W7Y099_9FUNG|nr:hypothetical protein LPJ53_003628 [Coemansia erecta]